MAKQLQMRRGTTAQHQSFTGAAGELTVNTDTNTVVVHDGSQAGGFSSGNLMSMTVYTTGSGNWTRPSGCKSIHVHVTGAGGGGGGMGDGMGYDGNWITPKRGMAVGGGGGAGGTAISVIDVSAIGSPYQIAYVVGTGGVNPDSATNYTLDGTDGVASTFAAPGGTLTGGPGLGGDNAIKYPNAAGLNSMNMGGCPAGGAGGIGSGGQLNLTGNAGQGGTVHWEHSSSYTSHHPSAGHGGASYWGGVGRAAFEEVPSASPSYTRHNSATPDAVDGLQGAGGSGGRCLYEQWGSDGGKGLIVIYEYA